ncbi:hypothetical protein [Thiocapsa sp.]|uniref:hypothetical protein n=1 Tax=Thiocapsa sp. TaxID=2024551 RepID=UPI002C49708D|nr:hypothetical protein [Thiocapsa sp.]HSO81639.1 hypothetical protein [Thiocapsa sp.]
MSEDALYAIGEPEISNAPGPSNEASRYRGAFADLRWRETSLAIKILHDDYSDLGAFLTPRLAAVWRIDEANILKLQDARAFRPPTFYEREYPGRESIAAGEIATYELEVRFKPFFLKVARRYE